MKEIKSLYIHFPYCRHLCNYCDFYKHKLISNNQIEVFEKVLDQQILSHQNLLDDKSIILRNLETIYVGGGTPSLWSIKGSEYIFKNIIQKYGLAKNFEFTIEVDPGTWTKEEINKWLDIGVNRFSIGVQSYDEDYLKVLDRSHAVDEVKETLEYLKEIGANFSVDLMLGIPKHKHKKRNILKEIDELVTFAPSHFSIYILKCRSNYPLLKKIPGDDEVADEYLEVCSHMNKNGYKQYEVSNFALEGKESRHNTQYWKYESVAGIGPTASGLIVENERSALRYKWKTSSGEFVTEVLEGASLTIEKLYMQLRAKGCLDLNQFDRVNQISFNNLVNVWTKRGYVASRNPSFELSAMGYLMLDSLMSDIFNNLKL